MSCTINNMGGAGSAVPKLRDELTFTMVGGQQYTTAYTATQDCYVKLTFEGYDNNSWQNEIFVNQSKTGCTIRSNNTYPYFDFNRDYLSNKLISSISGGNGTSGSSFCEGITILLEAGDALNINTTTPQSGHTIKIAVYY